ncbi:hypothetical protein RHS04_05545 [Rhizoctonia solani]|uniref:Uncharacterized protein n=1 Tax=Rhizoctonia solani TaxID=456999 RepID=A0A8H7H5R8_9AGAM|nr:hypothetical protein RHS04_05545 [Rhizoctonia solani]
MFNLGYGRQTIDRIPYEVLSHIFALSKQTEVRRRGHADLFCLTVLPIWSVITLWDGPPFHFSGLCLDRSGTSTPLDIEIYLSSRFLSTTKPDTYADAMRRALNFIVAHGGAPSRWRSFWIYTPEGLYIEAQEAALEFVQSLPLLSLYRFEVQFHGSERTRLERYRRSALSQKPLFHTLPTRLKVATLERIPNSCLFASPGSPLLVGLTCLKFEFYPTPPKLEDINALLAASPMLEILSIDVRYLRSRFSFGSYGQTAAETSCLPKIYLPKLRSLALLFKACHYSLDWEHSLFHMLDAPNVRFLRFRLQNPTSRNKDIVNYFAKGLSPSDPSPLFPHLIGLDLLFEQNLVPYVSSGDLYTLYETVLMAYPSIKTLILLDRAWDDMFELRSWTLPCLERLVVGSASPSGLKALISARNDAGLGLKTLEVLLSVSRSHQGHLFILLLDRAYILPYAENTQFPKPWSYGPEWGLRVVGNTPDDPINRCHAIEMLEIPTTTDLTHLHLDHTQRTKTTAIWVSWCILEHVNSSLRFIRAASVIEAVKNAIPGVGQSNTEEEEVIKPDETPLSPRSEQTKFNLEKGLKERPEKQELVNRNILKGEFYSKVAPALQAAQDRLQRSQLEDKLDKALENRPKPEELVKNGILNSKY